MDLVKLYSKLEKGTVYLKDDYEDIVLRMVVIANSTHCFIKCRGRKEVEVHSTDKDILILREALNTDEIDIRKLVNLLIDFRYAL